MSPRVLRPLFPGTLARCGLLSIRGAVLLAVGCLALAARKQDPVPAPDSTPPPNEGVVQEPARQDPPREPPGDAQGEPPQEPSEEPPEEEPEDLATRASVDVIPNPLDALTWPQRVARDARLSWSLRSAAAASAALDRPESVALRRGAAWLTLAYAGSAADRVRIATQARNGEGLERRGAILALGECGADEPGLFASIADDPDPTTAECGLLALLRTRRPAAIERVEAVARDAEDPRSTVAASLLAFQRDPSSQLPPRAARTLLELRWEAARTFGRVDGEGYTIARVGELAASPAIVAEVVLRAAARLPGSASDDHILSALLDGKGTGRIVAAVDAFPRQLSQLVDSGLWAPREVAEWSAALDEIDRERVEAVVPEFLSRAAEVPGLGWKARALLARGGGLDVADLSQTDFADLDADERAYAADALGSTTEAAARVLLATLSQDSSARVRGAALVARARMGDKNAVLALDKVLRERGHEDHTAAVESLCRNAREIAVELRLEEFLKSAVGADLVGVSEALTTQGRTSGRETVRSILGLDAPPTGARRLRLVRALSRRPTEKDVEILAQIFPQPGEEALNVELAVAMAAYGDPSVRPILRAALWGQNFDVSVLAGALLADANGVRVLIEEIQRPPPTATAADLRRVGFALGEWGGVEALRALSQASGSAAGPELQGALLGALGGRTK